MAVCSDIHTKHTNTVCGQNVQFAVSTVTTGLYWPNSSHSIYSNSPPELNTAQCCVDMYWPIRTVKGKRQSF